MEIFKIRNLFLAYLKVKFTLIRCIFSPVFPTSFAENIFLQLNFFLPSKVLPHKPVDGVSEIFRNLVQLEAFLVPFSQKLIEKSNSLSPVVIHSTQFLTHMVDSDGGGGGNNTITIFRLFPLFKVFCKK